MDALEQAKQHMSKAEKTPDIDTKWTELIVAYAAIAQAEAAARQAAAMERIADALENIMSVYSIDMTMTRR